MKWDAIRFFMKRWETSCFRYPVKKPLLPEEVPFRIQKATEWVEEVLGYRPEAFPLSAPVGFYCRCECS